MAIQNNTYFRIIGTIGDPTGATQISVVDGANTIGGAVNEQEVVLEDSNHIYSTTNRRAILDAWSIGAPSSSTSKFLYKEATAAVVSFDVALEAPATVGTDRRSVAFVAQYQGRLKVEILRADTGASVASYTGSNETSPITEAQTLTWATHTDVVVRVSLAPVASTTDAILWGIRALEAQTSI
jgi:hypothetical protein